MLNKLSKAVHDAAVKKGFYQCKSCEGPPYEELKDGYGKKLKTGCPFCKDTGVTPEKSRSESLMLIVTELSKAIQADRLGNHANIELFEKCIENQDGSFSSVYREIIHNTYEAEIVGALLRILDHARYEGIDLDKMVKYQMQYNTTRPAKNGKRY